MAQSPQFRMADRLARGKLLEDIARHREAGLSFDAIASRLFADYHIEVTGNTVANWEKLLSPAEPEAAAQ